MNQLLRGVVHWEAVCEGLSTAIALGFLYVIRCSVHGAALKKNIPNLSRTVLQTKQQAGISKSPMILKKPVSIRSRKFSEFVDIESIMQAPTNSRDERRGMAMVVQAKPTNISLKAILPSYGLSQLVAAIVGGFAVTPSVAASSTMFSVCSKDEIMNLLVCTNVVLLPRIGWRGRLSTPNWVGSTLVWVLHHRFPASWLHSQASIFFHVGACFHRHDLYMVLQVLLQDKRLK